MRAHYRSPLNYSDVHLDDAKGALTRLYTALKTPPGLPLSGEEEARLPLTRGAGGVAVDWNEPHAQRFKAAMDDDFNTPEAVAVLFDLANEVNKSDSLQLAAQLKALGSVLGLLQRDPQEFLQGRVTGQMNKTMEHFTKNMTGTQSHTPESINHLIEARIAAKQAKNYAEADRIRKELLAAGIVLEDSASGTTWRRA